MRTLQKSGKLPRQRHDSDASCRIFPGIPGIFKDFVGCCQNSYKIMGSLSLSLFPPHFFFLCLSICGVGELGRCSCPKRPSHAALRPPPPSPILSSWVVFLFFSLSLSLSPSLPISFLTHSELGFGGSFFRGGVWDFCLQCRFCPRDPCFESPRCWPPVAVAVAIVLWVAKAFTEPETSKKSK